MPAPRLDSVTPNHATINPNKNTVVNNIELRGEDFQTPDDIAYPIFGAGITTKDRRIVDNQTAFADIEISKNAIPGDRDVTVTNEGGTSNPVTFTLTY